ncbi:MAG: hypothetical protein ABFD92_06860 [Planctomycetaceae bacterium]|nr:hypothetical protein [Planctomycetaceae bacterium]
MKRRRTSRAFAYILTLILLSIMMTLAAAMTNSSALSMISSSNLSDAARARLSAESGLAFLLTRMRGMRLGADTTEATFAANMAAALGPRLNGTSNLAGAAVTAGAQSVTVPAIATPDGSFSAVIAWCGPNRCRVSVAGSARGLTRNISIELLLVPRNSAAFNYGLASRGPLSISGSARILGVNSPSEASILSATTSDAVAVSLAGSAIVAGDATVVQDPRFMVISGSPSLGGTSNPLLMAQHIHAVAEPPDFPQVDVTTLAPLATNRLTTQPPNQVATLTNIRIAAGLNPVFNNDVVINGIIYVEAPNNVRFEGKAVINGMVVTEPSNQPLSACTLRFAGNVEAYGVETLPATAEFAAIRAKTGTFVLAPGFDVTFAGNFSAINGTIAADKLTFTGTATGTVKGAVIGLAPETTSVGGNVDILVDRQNASSNPAGFVQTFTLTPQGATYREGGS